MIILNFSHPLTTPQLAQIGQLLTSGMPAHDQEPGKWDIFDIPCQFDNGRSFTPQVSNLIKGIALTPTAWQTAPLLINPPAYAPATAVLLAEIHGRCGYFPPIMRVRPVPNSLPPRYEIAEIINLQVVREKARRQR